MDRSRMFEYKEACKYVPTVVCDNEHQMEMFANAYFAACDIIGGLENTFYDYDEDDPEYISAKKYLADHERLADDIYFEATSSFYGAGCISGGARAKEIVKSYRFAGKEWTVRTIEEIVKSMGY